MDNKIFISIASYRDKLLKNTILQAYNNAEHKDRLIFGVFEQAKPEESINLNEFDFKDQIRYQRVDPETSRGVCWARKHVQDFYNDEQYYLQIDAHMLFDPGWDRWMINRLEEIKKYQPKPIITGYPNAFNPNNFEEKIPYNPRELIVVNTGPERNEHFRKLNFCPPAGNYIPSEHEIVYGFHLGACFIFSDGHFVRNVPYDDAIFFGGEEPMLSLRAWTHGYDIFHTKNLPLYHCWDKSYGGVVHSDIDSVKSMDYIDAAFQHIERLVHNQIADPYGLGQQRSIQQYIAYSGINYFARHFQNNPSMFQIPYYEKITYDVN